jgi:apolipoprotein N-acyltransferase
MANSRMSEPQAVMEESAAKAEKEADAAKAPGSAASPLPAKIAYPLAFLTGFLYFLAFPGVDIWPLSFVALAPLIIALRGQKTRRATGLGWLAGFTMTMFGFYWLLEMLKVFSGFGPVICFFFMAILCAYQAGRIAMAGWLYGRAESRGWPAAPVFALAFVASELVFPLLFPWYYGATVHNAWVFAQVADLGGGYLVGLVLVAANLGVAEIVIAMRDKRARDRRILAIAVAAPLLALAYGYPRMLSIDAKAAAAPSVKVGIISGNQPLIGRRHALAVHQKRTKELREKGVDLVIWSEGGSGTVTRESPGYPEARQVITNRLGVPTIVGGLLAKKASHGHYEYFNSALLSDDKGKIIGRYDKQYLLAFGEYLPFGDVFPQLYQWSPNSSRFARGTSLEPLVWGDHKIAALICYEDILPDFVNGMVKHADPDLIVNLTNDAWFGDSTEPWIHMALAKMRAIEHRRYLVRSTNSGVSALIDPVGRVPLHGGTFKEEALIGVAKWMRASTVYEAIGDWPWILASVAIFGMAFLRREQVMAKLGKG